MKPLSPQTAILATLLPNHSLLIRPDAWPDFAGPLNRLPKLGTIRKPYLPHPVRLDVYPAVAVFRIPDHERPGSPDWYVVWNLGGAPTFKPLKSDLPPLFDQSVRQFVMTDLEREAKRLQSRLAKAMVNVTYDAREKVPEILPGVWLAPHHASEGAPNLQAAALFEIGAPIGHKASLHCPTADEALSELDKLRMGEGIRIVSPPLADLPDFAGRDDDFICLLNERDGQTVADYWRVTPRPHKGWSSAFQTLFDDLAPGDSFLMPDKLVKRTLPNLRNAWKRYSPTSKPLVTRRDPATGGVFVWRAYEDDQYQPDPQNHVTVKPGSCVEIDGVTLQIVSGRPMPAPSSKVARFKSESPREGYPVLQPGHYIEVGATPDAEALARTWRMRMTRAKLSASWGRTPDYIWYIQRLASNQDAQPRPFRADPAQTLMTGGGTVAEALAKHLPPQPEPQP